MFGWFREDAALVAARVRAASFRLTFVQGDVATHLQVFGLVDHTHAPAADPAEDAIMGNRLSHEFGGSRRGEAA
jgi:hypothetical protein